MLKLPGMHHRDSGNQMRRNRHINRYGVPPSSTGFQANKKTRGGKIITKVRGRPPGEISSIRKKKIRNWNTGGRAHTYLAPSIPETRAPHSLRRLIPEPLNTGTHSQGRATQHDLQRGARAENTARAIQRHTTIRGSSNKIKRENTILALVGGTFQSSITQVAIA